MNLLTAESGTNRKSSAAQRFRQLSGVLQTRRPHCCTWRVKSCCHAGVSDEPSGGRFSMLEFCDSFARQLSHCRRWVQVAPWCRELVDGWCALTCERDFRVSR